LLHISTDHYYPYGKNKPHTEADPIFFMNQYSVQKYAAEAYALTSSNALVVRTSILGQRKLNGLSLVDWAIKALKNNEKIKLFHDAWTSSIDVGTFANLACKIFFEHQQRGLINLAAREVYSKEMLIRELASRLDLSLENCVSLSINDYFTNRPNCLGLDVSKAELLLGYELPSMNDVLDSLLLDYKY
jgi:dTDP-4-dehydrorhamnose reductase